MILDGARLTGWGFVASGFVFGGSVLGSGRFEGVGIAFASFLEMRSAGVLAQNLAFNEFHDHASVPSAHCSMARSVYGFATVQLPTTYSLR